ncbi:MAG: DUF2235 domain-containing protein [Methylibium sp.]|nr:DUF2235 domain-containing protein [Methylibium sp.]
MLARVLYRSARQQPAAAATARVGDRALELLGMASARAADPPGKASGAAANSAASQLPGALNLPADPQSLIDHRYLWDAQGNLLFALGEAGVPNRTGYAYDDRDRLIVAAQARGSAGEASRYFYDPPGRRVLSQQGIAEQGDLTTRTRKARYQAGTHRWLSEGERSAEHGAPRDAQYDASGQPRRIGGHQYLWDALGRLTEVREDGRTVAGYRYSHRGERIGKTAGGRTTAYLYDSRQLLAEADEQGRIVRQYVYLADRPIAVIDTPQGKAPEAEELSALRRIWGDVRTAVSAWLGDGERMVWLHDNHLGAVEAATGKDGQVIWQAVYQPFGQAKISSAAFEFNLRLPGQYEDAETGLHYNHHRYYDPQRGEYVTPDPLGTPDGPNRYSYVRYNPLKYVDPLGLILFAFDGTGNNDPAGPGSIVSNVVKFRDLYNDGAPYYISGPGTVDAATGIGPSPSDPGGVFDMSHAYTGKARVTAMIDYLHEYANSQDDDTAIDIDITGFSRGAAEARDFANQLVGNLENGYYKYTDEVGEQRCQLLNFRFMGLFDTVLSTHTGSYKLQIPEAFGYVAHAVALNEYRGGAVAFPVESILGGLASTDKTRIERGFLGSHSDIGGSFAQDDLSKVALVWMVEQAKAAGVKMYETDKTIIANPVIHDKSDNLINGASSGGPAAISEDRDVRYADGSKVKQRKMTTGVMSYADTVPFISYLSNPLSSNSVSGTVDMNGYLGWLNANGYGIEIAVE